nr:hypothetical protein CFP56_58980 [Quercus suber]
MDVWAVHLVPSVWKCATYCIIGHSRHLCLYQSGIWDLACIHLNKETINPLKMRIFMTVFSLFILLLILGLKGRTLCFIFLESCS